eukprot:1177707-Prorocentrum_minimum.AAC.3
MHENNGTENKLGEKNWEIDHWVESTVKSQIAICPPGFSNLFAFARASFQSAPNTGMSSSLNRCHMHYRAKRPTERFLKRSNE